MASPLRPLRVARAALLAALLACGRGGGAGDGAVAAVRIEAVMADPADVPDERGEWLRVRNLGAAEVRLGGWTLASGSDGPHRIARDVALRAGATLVLARSAGSRAAYAYGGGIALGNGADWVALRDAAGRTVDSVAWSSARRGVEMTRADFAAGRAPATAGGAGAPVTVPGPRTSRPPAAGGASPLVVRVLDVGQGDAILVENGGSRALIDGGADPATLGRHLDRLGLDGDTIDVVVVTHAHLDHYNGLRELFRSRRRITVRYVFDARDASPNRTLDDLRDSVDARARRRVLESRDADDPCADGRPACTVTLRGGARLQVWRPWPSDTAGPNNRSVMVRLASADSAFTMWMAGDAEREAIAWMERSGYPLDADVLKANHHGSCDGIGASYLRRVSPALVVMSLASPNDYGYVHAQTTGALRDAGVPWLRTDQNGTVTITVPGRDGRAWDAAVERGGTSARGPSDRASRDDKCRR